MLDDDTVLDADAGVEDHNDSYKEQGTRDARRRESGESQKYAGRHDDLHHLWCWGTVIGWMQEDHARLYAQAGWNYLPTAQASGALMRLSVKYPIIVTEIQNWQAKAEAAFEIWLDTRTREAESLASEMIGLLGDRVLANTDIIAELEGVTPNPRKIESRIRSRDRSGENGSGELAALVQEPELDDDGAANGSDERTADASANASDALEELLGDEARQILDIARSDKTVDERYRGICGVDRRLVHWDSVKIAKVLSVEKLVTPSAVRQTSFWKVDRAGAIEAERDRREDEHD